MDEYDVHESVKKLSDSLKVTDFTTGSKQSVVAHSLHALHAFEPCC